MKKDNKGFTLVEVIISIAILAIISGFIMQMFVVASRRTKLMDNEDTSFNLVIQIVEIFKSASSHNDDFADKLQDLDVKIGKNYYNKDWDLTTLDLAEYVLDVTLAPLNNNVYELSITSGSMDGEETYININTARYFYRGGSE